MQNQEPRPPPGFEPLFRTSPFLDTVGPLFYRKEPDGGFVVGLRILAKHANARGSAHGGLLLTLIDVALGYRAAFSQDPPAALTTASVSNSPPWALPRAFKCFGSTRTPMTKPPGSLR